MKTNLAVIIVILCLPAPPAVAASDWTFGLYLDAAYLDSDNKPENKTWRSKGTTSSIDRVEINMARAFGRKTATTDSRWGVEFGFQAGIDANALLTAVPPPAEAPVKNADEIRHLSTTTVSYLFDMGNGLLVTGGLMGSYIGYESYFSRDNPNYTRGYLSDYVPYFLWGAQATYPLNDSVTLGAVLTTGVNYLSAPNNTPSFGALVAWNASPTLTVKQNLYYGSDQSNTSLEYWRFFSDTIVEWRKGRFLVAGAFDFGYEKQAWLDETPQYSWMSGAIWGRIDLSETWRIAVRPEFFSDPDGLMTEARQEIWAITATAEYHTSFLEYNNVSARAEYRYDKSTGLDGGFYQGDFNRLVPDQNLLMLSLVWAVDWSPNR